MEIRCDPNISVDATHCPVCTSLLRKELGTRKDYEEECYSCRYGTRPFAVSRGQCTCPTIKCMYIYCDSCRAAVAAEAAAEAAAKAKLFSDTWKSSSPQEKLQMYGLEKLRILAKGKIPRYSTYKKNELISLLAPLVKADDFPIRQSK